MVRKYRFETEFLGKKVSVFPVVNPEDIDKLKERVQEILTKAEEILKMHYGEDVQIDKDEINIRRSVKAFSVTASGKIITFNYEKSVYEIYELKGRGKRRKVAEFVMPIEEIEKWEEVAKEIRPHPNVLGLRVSGEKLSGEVKKTVTKARAGKGTVKEEIRILETPEQVIEYVKKKEPKTVDELFDIMDELIDEKKLVDFDVDREGNVKIKFDENGDWIDIGLRVD